VRNTATRNTIFFFPKLFIFAEMTEMVKGRTPVKELGHASPPTLSIQIQK